VNLCASVVLEVFSATFAAFCKTRIEIFTAKKREGMRMWRGKVKGRTLRPLAHARSHSGDEGRNRGVKRVLQFAFNAPGMFAGLAERSTLRTSRCSTPSFA